MEMNLNSDDQDRVIYLSIVDTHSIAKFKRKKIEPRHFSSEVRQKVYRIALEFFEKYERAVSTEITTEIDQRIARKKIREEDKIIYEEYLYKLVDIPEFSKEMVLDRLDFFVKVRIVRNLSNDLIKLQDRFEIDPDKSLDLIREAATEANSSIGRDGAESILYETDDLFLDSEYVTKFGIDLIDDQLEGGLRRQDYVVIQAFLGIGKSWCVNHLAKMAVRFGFCPLIIPTEMPNRQARIRFKKSLTGMNTKEILENQNKVKQQMIESMNRGADIYLLSEEEKRMAVDELPAVIEDIEIKTGNKISLLLLDSADEFQPPAGRYRTPLDANTAIHTYLKNLAKDNNMCIVTTAQAKREGASKYWLNAASVADNINKFRKATVGISLNATEDEASKWFYRMWLFKNTNGNAGARVWCKRDYERGQFITKYGRWEKVPYQKMVDGSPVLTENKK